jgi:hypothetical protein
MHAQTALLSSLYGRLLLDPEPIREAWSEQHHSKL